MTDLSTATSQTSTGEPTSVYRYARRDRMPDFMQMGWIDHGLCPRHHGEWSYLVRACVCNPNGREPLKHA